MSQKQLFSDLLDCPANWTKGGTKCYMAFNATVKVSDAPNFCQGQAAQVPAPVNVEMWKGLQASLNTLTTGNYWFGQYSGTK